MINAHQEIIIKLYIKYHNIQTFFLHFIFRFVETFINSFTYLTEYDCFEFALFLVMMHFHFFSPGHGKLRDLGGVSEQLFRPVFRKIPNDLSVPEGQVARFDSVVAGRPIPDMLWFRDDVQIFDDRLHKIVINEEGINSLIFDAVAMSDAGHYTCIAQNRAGEDRFQVSLNVLRKFLPQIFFLGSDESSRIAAPCQFRTFCFLLIDRPGFIQQFIIRALLIFVQINSVCYNSRYLCKRIYTEVTVQLNNIIIMN